MKDQPRLRIQACKEAGAKTTRQRAQFFQRALYCHDINTEMMNRITRKVYRFPEEFQLADMDCKQPAGRYEVKSEEEPIGDVMFGAYRRISTTIYIPPAAGASGIGLFVETTPSELATVAQEE